MNLRSKYGLPWRNSAAIALVLALASTLACADELTESADAAVRAARENLRIVDNGQADRLWDMAPSFVRQRVEKSTFVGSISKSRQSVGMVVQRTWTAVERFRYDSEVGAFPPGQYVSVYFSTRTSDNKRLTEMVSLRLEPSGWRLIGYNPQPAPPKQ